jgi:ligand-binding sensor domain-containing protein
LIKEFKTNLFSKTMTYNQTHGISLILCLIASYLLISGCVKSENVIDPDSLEAWEFYNTGNGLGSDSVWTMAEDEEGNIWVGSMNNGVSKFDGKTWAIYNFENGFINNSVFSIAQDGYGNMWFGTYGGLSILRDNEWTNMPEFGGVHAILKDHDDNMWLSSENYPILEYKNNTWYQYYDDECALCNLVNVFFEDAEGNLWIGSEADLKILTSNSTTSYTQSDGLPGGAIMSMHQDIWGNIWIGTRRSVNVAKYNNGKFELVSLSNGLSINWVSSIASDNNGNVWFGSLGIGALKYNGSAMEPHTVKDGLPSNSVTKILKDKHGALWFGTLDSGIAKFMPGMD